jgi:hypothetical protein
MAGAGTNTEYKIRVSTANYALSLGTGTYTINTSTMTLWSIIASSITGRYYGDGSSLTGVQATGLADNSVTGSKIAANVIASTHMAGAWTNTEYHILVSSANYIGSTVLASSIAVNAVYPAAARSGLYTNIQVSSVAINSVETRAIMSGSLGTSVLVSSIAINSVQPNAIMSGSLGASVIVSSLAIGNYGMSSSTMTLYRLDASSVTVNSNLVLKYKGFGVSVADDASSNTVTLNPAQPDTNYAVCVALSWGKHYDVNGSTVTVSSWVSNKQTGQFDVNFSSAAKTVIPAGTSKTFDWFLVR